MVAWAAHAQAPPTIEEFLATKHVPCTPRALKAALNHPDRTVRGAAAMLLVSDKVPGAMALVGVALQREHDPDAALNLARALRVGGDPQGETRIRALCTDPKASDDVQYAAAQELRPYLDEGCVQSLVRMADSPPTNTVLVIPALQLLVAVDPPRALAIGPKLSLLPVLTHNLQSELALERVLAVQCLVLFQVAGARPVAQRALERERDTDARGEITRALSLLPR